MESSQYPPATPPASPPQAGLAIASLVLGILALFTSVLLIGALLGLLALGLAVAHLARRSGPNGMAWSGVVLGVLSLLLSAGSATLYFKVIRGLHKERVHITANATGQAQPSNWIGVKAPDFTVTTLDGNTLGLHSLRGRRVVLDFWATWCSPCRMEIPHFNQLAEENSTNQFLIVGISSEDESTVRRFCQEQEVRYPIACATNLPPPFKDIHAVPTTFFIDRHGVIQDVLVGYQDYERLKKSALGGDMKGHPKRAPTVQEQAKPSRPADE